MNPTTQAAVIQAAEVQRVRLGLKKQDVATSMGISPASLTKRYNGSVPLDLDEVDRLAQALDLDPFDLLAAARHERLAA